jgi:hypothetical protein
VFVRGHERHGDTRAAMHLHLGADDGEVCGATPRRRARPRTRAHEPAGEFDARHLGHVLERRGVVARGFRQRRPQLHAVQPAGA